MASAATRCAEPFDPSLDAFTDEIHPRYARGFTVEYFSHYKVVTVADPARPGGRWRYLLLPCGVPRPDGWPDAQQIEIPVRALITTSTTELPHLVALGLVDRLVGHDEFDYVSSPEIHRRIDRGAMVEVGSGAQLNIERVIEIDPDLVLSDSLGNPEFDALGKLREAQVPVALAPSYLETTPLGRAEWLLYTALFFNREAAAAEIFAEVADSYTSLAALGRAVARRPTVVSSAPISGTWYIPGGRSYIAELLADAGAEYLWADDGATGSLALDLETVYERAVDADFWLYPSTWTTLSEIGASDERFLDFAALRSGRIYNNHGRVHPRGGNDFWETGTARPDLVLADLLRIFHPGLLPAGDLVFHRRIDG